MNQPKNAEEKSLGRVSLLKLNILLKIAIWNRDCFIELLRVQQGYLGWNGGCDLHQKRLESMDEKGGIIHRLKQIWSDQNMISNSILGTLC